MNSDDAILASPSTHREARMDEELGQKILDNLFLQFVAPEIQQRQNLGSWPEPYKLSELRKFQIVFYAKGGNAVLLNDEVRADIELQEGSDSALVKPNVGDDGHATFALMDGRWYGQFSFLYHRETVQRYISVSQQFYAVAAYSLEKKLWAPFFENLWACAELAFKAYAICMGHETIKESRRHGMAQGLLNLFCKEQKIETDQKDAFNLLSRNREKARYAASEISVDEADARKYLQSVGEILELAKESVFKTPPHLAGPAD
jgi:HEPN domain